MDDKLTSLNEQLASFKNSSKEDSTSVMNEMKRLRVQVEDMNLKSGLSPQQASLLREVRDDVKSQIAEIPSAVKVLLSTDFKKLENCVGKLSDIQGEKMDEAISLLQQLLSVSLEAGKNSLRNKHMERLIKPEGDEQADWKGWVWGSIYWQILWRRGGSESRWSH